jgi:hypothetical protein
MSRKMSSMSSEISCRYIDKIIIFKNRMNKTPWVYHNMLINTEDIFKNKRLILSKGKKIFITGQIKENLNQVFSRCTRCK